MSDMHVKNLFYRLVTEPDVTFHKAPPREGETPEFKYRIDSQHLTIEMKDHYSVGTEARKHVEPYLRAWQIDSGISFGRNAFSFEFVRSEIIDRDPPTQGEPNIVQVDVSEDISLSGAALVCFAPSVLPPPPCDFITTPDVETMWHRYNGYRAGREPLASMAYFCLNVLELSGGGRREAAKKYGIEEPVLSQLGRLSSTVGDTATARKMSAAHQNRPHTDAEKAWMEAAVRSLFRRVGQSAANNSSINGPLVMGDLPQLQ